MNTYLLVDEVNGRTIKLLLRVSSTRLARKAAREFSKHSHEGFYLMRLKDGGEREIVRHYEPRATPPKSALSALGRRI